MPIDKKLLQILACPDCKADVKYTKTKRTEKLICTKCRRIFQVKNNIPIMLPKDDD